MRPLRLLVAAVLLLANLAIYAQTFHYTYIDFDDDQGLFKNPIVRAGLSPAGIAWAFSTFHLGNWIPLAWLSHMLDFTLFGSSPGWHHLVNVLIHIANTLLLFLLFVRTTHAVRSSAVVAALFSLHPLRVESVAWIIERKDVLSAFFWILTLWLYVLYVERPSSRRRYSGLLVVFSLGLLAKPMLVTLPFVLLLLDYWPLGRFKPEARPSSSWHALMVPLIREKAFLFVLAGGLSALAMVAQRHGGALRSLDQIPLGARTVNAVVACAGYVVKTVWPGHLVVYYPYDLHLPAWKVGAAALFLVAATVLSIRAAARRPYVAVGWLWYLGTLVPVIGLVQVGTQAMADRYTYLPSIGLLILAVGLVFDWQGERTTAGERLREEGGWGVWQRSVPMGAAGIAAIILALLSWNQARYWRNSVTLFEHALRVSRDNPLAQYNLATALAEEGRIDEAIVHYEESLRVGPPLRDAHEYLGLALFKRGRTEEAISHYRAELRLNPDHAEAHCNLGVALAVEGKMQEALAEFQEAVRIRPGYAGAYLNAGIALEKMGRHEEAIAAYSRSLELEPENADARYKFAMTLADRGRLPEAIAHLSRLVQTHPAYPHAAEDLQSLRMRVRSGGA